MPEMITDNDAHYAYEIVQIGLFQPGRPQGHDTASLQGTTTDGSLLSPEVGWAGNPDHTVDGAPAARFVRRLVELIESGHGLDEDQFLTTLDAEPAAAQTAHVPAPAGLCSNRSR